MNIRSESLEKNRTLGNGHHLPEIGASFVNPVGIECLVANHMHVPTAYSCQRYRDGKGNQPEDLFPVIRIKNLSKKLLDFINVIDLCSPKQLLILDTMPQVKSIMPPGGHFVDTLSVPDSILLFIDAYNVQEIHLAHEIGHLWVQYVDLAEDERVLRDVSDPARLNQFSFIQSFVIDRRVNEVIEEKGFDVSLIAEDQWKAVASLGRAMAAGYRPETKREGVFMAIALANQMLEEDKRSLHSLAISSDTMSLVYQHCPELFGLANGLADAVREFGYSDKWCIQKSIDRCLELAFTYTGDPIDLFSDVHIPEQELLEEDRHPEWITGAPFALKREVGRFMATYDVPLDASYVLHQLPGARCAITFEIPSGETIGPYQLETTWQFEDTFSNKLRIEEINRQNRERIMKQQELGRKGIPNLPGQPRRFYMAGLGRFTTRVREREWLGGENPYGYAQGNPVTWIDPTGHYPIFPSSAPAFCYFQKPPGIPDNIWSILCPGFKEKPRIGITEDIIFTYGNFCGQKTNCTDKAPISCIDTCCQEHDNAQPGAGPLDYLLNAKIIRANCVLSLCAARCAAFGCLTDNKEWWDVKKTIDCKEAAIGIALVFGKFCSLGLPTLVVRRGNRKVG